MSELKPGDRVGSTARHARNQPFPVPCASSRFGAGVDEDSIIFWLDLFLSLKEG